MSTSISLSTLFLGALLLLAGCGAGGYGSDYPTWGGPDCVDSAGFPVPCDHWDAQPFKAEPTASAGWLGSANGPLVSDADGDFLAFAAAAPHGLTLSTYSVPGLRAATDGRVYWLEEAVGYVALVRSDAGDLVAALVAENGTFLDLEIEDGGLVLRRTAQAAALASFNEIPAGSDVALETGLPLATMGDAAMAAGAPARPAGALPGDPLLLDDLASTDVIVELW